MKMVMCGFVETRTQQFLRVSLSSHWLHLKAKRIGWDLVLHECVKRMGDQEDLGLTMSRLSLPLDHKVGYPFRSSHFGQVVEV